MSHQSLRCLFIALVCSLAAPHVFADVVRAAPVDLSAADPLSSVAHAREVAEERAALAEARFDAHQEAAEALPAGTPTDKPVETPLGSVPEHLAWVSFALVALRAVFAWLRRAPFWVGLPPWVRMVVMGLLAAGIAFGDSYSTGAGLLTSVLVGLAAVAGGTTNGDMLATIPLKMRK